MNLIQKVPSQSCKYFILSILQIHPRRFIQTSHAMLLLLLKRWTALGTLLSSLALQAFDLNSDPQRHRIVIETDAGGDPDDEQSLVRFLLYANEWDVEGIIANRPTARDGENRNPHRTGLGIVKALVEAYSAVQSNLVHHDSRYPSAKLLQSVTVAGYDTTRAGVDLIIRAADRDDGRPIWYADWGSDRGSATNNLRRALDQVLRDRGNSGYAQFKSRFRILGYDKFGEHSTRAPYWRLWVNTFQPEHQGKRWYHQFSALTSNAAGFDVFRDVLMGHGPLGALYPTNTTHWLKEGDSATFLYLVPTGLNDPAQPTWGSWAGRYGPNPDSSRSPMYWANQEDTWNGTFHRNNSLLRWAIALQNDFKARMDWCVQPRSSANHPPQPVLNGVAGRSILQLVVAPGEIVRLDATGSLDPDGQELNYEWFEYPECGTYRKRANLKLIDSHSTAVHWVVPQDADGFSAHFVLAATDRGSPPLTRYRRAIVHVRSPETARQILAPYLAPPPGWIGLPDQRRSPLTLPDGSKISKTEEWAKRREELLREWHEILGSWPEVLRHPRFESIREEPRDGFRQRRIRVEIAENQFGEAWLLEPKGSGPFPAALVVYYEPETSVGLNPKQSHRDYALQLARRGFVTLAIGTPGGNAYKPDIGSARCQPLSFHAYVAANAWTLLANLPNVDPSRIGVVGHSYGGKWALFAAAFWERFACVAVSDPGIVFDETRSSINYWEPWYLGYDGSMTRKPGIPSPLNPRTGAYAKLMEQGRDLHELHALIAPRPFLISGGAEDPPKRWATLSHALEVNRLLGFTNRVLMTNRPNHDPDDAANEVLYAFFEDSLKFRSSRVTRP